MHTAGGNSNEDIKIKYISMIDDFKKQCIGMLDQSVGAFEEVLKSADTNFENVKQSYIKGFGDMKNEILKGNLMMVESFRKNCKMIQQNIEDSYNVLKGENMDIFSKNVNKFREQGSTAIGKYPTLASANFEEVINYLFAQQKLTLDSAYAKHSSFAKQLQESYEDTARKLTMSVKTLSP